MQPRKQVCGRHLEPDDDNDRCKGSAGIDTDQTRFRQWISQHRLGNHTRSGKRCANKEAQNNPWKTNIADNLYGLCIRRRAVGEDCKDLCDADMVVTNRKRQDQYDDRKAR